MKQNKNVKPVTIDTNNCTAITSKKNNNKFIFYMIMLLLALFISGIINGFVKVKADETNGLPTNYTAYKFQMSAETKQFIQSHNYTLSIEYDAEFGEWLEDSFLLCNDFLLSHCTLMNFDNSLRVECYVDNNIDTSGLEVVYDTITFFFTNMVNAKVLLVPNNLTPYIDSCLEYYTYSVDNPVYPLNQVLTKLDKSSEIYTLISDLDPFNELMLFGRDHYIYYYGSANANYIQGYNDGLYDGQQINGSAGILGVWKSVFAGMTDVIGVEILPGISIAMVLSIPIVFGLLILLYKFIGRG